MASSTESNSLLTKGFSYFSTPPSYIFKLPIGLDLPPGPPEGTLFASWFKFFMDVRVPIAIAFTYALSAHIANHFRAKNKEPLALTKTSLFKWLVIAHNLGLCIYSAWTCAGMTSAIYSTVFEVSKKAIAATVDQDQLDLYLNGSQGLLGDNNGQGINLSNIRSNFNNRGFWTGLCDMNDGIWEKGLSYYGFFFYLSKFYEVVDTMIILAKGRQSSLLQTYHHAGAMLSMWAGIRFASPPIWIFVVFNSLIHTIMYFYYTLSALKIKVPKILKRALTTAQICQFLFGGSFALLHMFVYYFKPETSQYTPCLGDSGQLFALLFNVAYLAPLTYLFVMFWIDSYVKNWKKAEDLIKSNNAKEEATSKSSSAEVSNTSNSQVKSRSRKD